jgi:hypothetical protein
MQKRKSLSSAPEKRPAATLREHRVLPVNPFLHAVNIPKGFDSPVK